MKIHVYEWPLPEDTNHCMSAVFELECPLEFAAWRNLTWMLIQDLGREGHEIMTSPMARLNSYDGLKMYYKSHSSRLSLASNTKPFAKAHYRELTFPVPKVDDCFVSNALQYRLFDSSKSCWIQEQAQVPSLRARCATKLPEGPYTNLQYAADSCSHSQNQVIADQDSCSKELSLHEFLSFGSLRSDGECIQWYNISREWSACNLNLNSEAVCTLITQAACQAGSKASSVYRSSHLVLADATFAKELLGVAAKALDSIRANWKSDHAMTLLIVIILRVFSLCTTPDVSDLTLVSLKNTRSVLHGWTETLEYNLHEAVEPSQVSRLQRRLLKTAVLCKMTYDVDSEYIAMANCSDDAMKVWIISCMLVREHTPSDIESLPVDLRRLLLRDKKLTSNLNRLFEGVIIANQSPSLDDAIRRVWSSFQRDTEFWCMLEEPNDRWLSTRTASTNGRIPKTVHYNTLDGELLVGGRPLGRLPADYVTSDIYRSVFGAQIFPILAADLPGVLFMSAKTLNGYIVYFGKRGPDVIIRAATDTQILEAVRQLTFDGDLPRCLIDGCIPWLNLTNRQIEFRPLSQRWESNPHNWWMQYSPTSTSSMSCDDRKLLDMQSSTCAAAVGIFGALDTLENLLVTFSGNSRLEITLPRYDLHFVLNDDGHFECLELCKIVDPNQSVGTLIGLKNRLVLCGTLPLSGKQDRILIIPDGQVSVHPTDTHIEVRIAVEGPKIRLFRYQIDMILGRLQEDCGILNVLFKAYLHAVSSYVLPDPLTGRTGTEEALSYLRQRSLRFTGPPSTQAIVLVKLISGLTPRRHVYPQHKRVMQRVEWGTALWMLSQHDDFLPLAQIIISSGDAYNIFNPDSEESPTLYTNTDSDLLERAKFRNACHRSINLGGSLEPWNHDNEYEGRDNCTDLTCGEKTYEVASLIRDWPQRLEVSRSIAQTLWSDNRDSELSGIGARFDYSRPLSELLDLQSSVSWGPLLELCRSSTRVGDTYRLLFLFPIIAYGDGALSLTMLRTLLAFAFIPELRNIAPIQEKYTYVLPANGNTLDVKILRSTIRGGMKRYSGPSKKQDSAAWHEAKPRYQTMCKEQTEAVMEHYQSQWPTDHPVHPPRSLASNLRWEDVHPKIEQLFFSWTSNGLYEKYLKRAQLILNSAYQESAIPKYLATDWHLYEEELRPQQAARLPPSIQTLMLENSPQFSSKPTVLTIQRQYKAAENNERLSGLIAAIRCDEGARNNRMLRAQYRDDLLASHEAYRAYQEPINPQNLPCSIDQVILNLMRCERHTGAVLGSIRTQMNSGKEPISRLLELGELWPRLTLRCLLSLLHSASSFELPRAWMECFLTLGEAVTTQQRARRLVLAAERKDFSTFNIEMENNGHCGWETVQWPDWLLIEIGNDLLIRPTQARVALEMIQPSSSENSLVQLNMGEGKSSVIVPLVAVGIADGTRLARVVVLKSLLKQMNDTLSQRLGGLVDRQIFYMPFSRKVQVSTDVITKIQNLQQHCLKDRGIMLAQPDHLLSFKLIGIERLTSGDLQAATELLRAQAWLDSKSRDILDESDEVLDVKFQLIYTLGSQRMMDGQPDRWLITQGIFDLVEKNAMAIANEFPGYIEINYRSPSSFPQLRLHTTKVGKALISRLAQDVVDNKLPNVHFDGVSATTRDALLCFMLDRDVSARNCLIMKDSFGNREPVMQSLLLLRGLFASGILLFVLRSKRWSVNYGLHPSRCFSAVPYRAKGVPASSAEFAHPDVAVALTCLSYYYSGLTNIQIRQAFGFLVRADDPSHEYTSWTSHCHELPQHLRSWTAVNLEDDRLCYEQLFPNLRYGKKIADYFMANIVFPREGKEFDEKLSTSSWDIVSKSKCHITTGFSGTKDARFVLPLSISQQDLLGLQHTSGKVLDFLLRKENLEYHSAQDSRGRQLSTIELVRYFTQLDSNVRVLIDVGAQVLDISNRDFVKTWLDIVPGADAGIFFDEDDNVMVLARDSKMEKLSVSSFQGRMDRCVVYFDEVHTRGTDLKLPATARAAVTLGPRLTKDRLIQACMRLRKLAQGQTLMYLAPPEVHNQLVKLSHKGGEMLDGYDVVAWALEQSCQSIERSQPLRILQGLHYFRRQKCVDDFHHAHPDLSSVARIDPASSLVQAFREKEVQGLSELYAPLHLKAISDPGIVKHSMESSESMVGQLLALWDGLENATPQAASMHEEHEREVAHEAEEETQIERPPKATPLTSSIDHRLLECVRSGRLELLMQMPTAYDAIMPTTSRQVIAEFRVWMHLRVTKDFAQTVEQPQSGYCDNYLRPTNWILTSKQESEPTFLLLISPYEANELLTEIKAPSSGVRLHIYEPRVAKSMGFVDVGPEPPPPFIEEWQCLANSLRRELNFFAGQLYFITYEDYTQFLRGLGPRFNVDIEATMGFLWAWISIRRKGQDFTQTHMGWLINRREIRREAFE